MTNTYIKTITNLAVQNQEAVEVQTQDAQALVELEIKNEISKYFHAKKFGMTNENAARKALAIQKLIVESKIDSNDIWINKFKNGELITNNFGRILFFKFK